MAASTLQTAPVRSSVSMSLLPEVDFDKSESPAAAPFVVKNTFIEVEEDDSPCSFRRCTSAPATPRGGETSTSSSSLGMKSSKSLPFSLSSPKSWADLSSSAQGAEEISTCTDECSLDSSETASVSSSREGMMISLDELLPARTPLRRNTLSSKAKAWVPPCQPTGGTAGLPPEVHLRFSSVMKAGAEALKACPFVQRADMNDLATSWSLKGFLQPQYFNNVGKILAAVQDKLLRAAEESNGVYVIGYESQPFQTICGKPGFRARLALVQDESSACWDLLAKGFCNRGCACRWQHPSWQVSIDVLVEPHYT